MSWRLARVRVSKAIGRGTGRGRPFSREGETMAIAFTDAQLRQVMTAAYQIPRVLRRRYLQRVSELLNGRDFGDGDVHHAARAAAGEILHGPRPALVSK
jgi:hypothetical protein